MPFDHEKITEHQQAMEFPVVEMPSEMNWHTLAARQGVAGCGRPDACGDLEQEQSRRDKPARGRE